MWFKMVVDHWGDHYSLASNNFANGAPRLQDMTTSLASNAISPGAPGPGQTEVYRPQDVDMQNESQFLGGKIGQSHGKNLFLMEFAGYIYIFVCL